MSYERPPGTAADASWVGKSGYVRPSPTAADASWAGGSSVATGFAAARLGVPSTPLPASGFQASRLGIPSLAMRAQGFCSTQFGAHETFGYYQAPSLGVVTAFGVGQREMVAEGFQAAVVGAPSTPTQASGFAVGWVGQPKGLEFWRHRSLPPTTVIPGAFSPVHSTGEATGFCETRAGLHTGLVINIQPIHNVARAKGFAAVRWGLPSTAVDTVGRATGLLATCYGRASSSASMLGVLTRFGLPLGRTTHGAASVPLGVGVGTPSGAVAGRAQGWSAQVLWGLPTGRAGYLAAGKEHARVGRPGAAQTGAGRAFPCPAQVRFGQPRGLLRWNYVVAGAPPSTAVGMPRSTQTWRARALAPVARLGTPVRGDMQC